MRGGRVASRADQNLIPINTLDGFCRPGIDRVPGFRVDAAEPRSKVHETGGRQAGKAPAKNPLR